MLLRGFALASISCLLSATAFAQQPNFGYSPPPGSPSARLEGQSIAPAAYSGANPSAGVRPASANMPKDAAVDSDIFKRAQKWQPNEPLDSRFAPTFYKRAKPSHLPPASVMNQQGFVPEVRTKNSWRDRLSWFNSWSIFD